MLDFFKEMALYNRWANQRLYEQAATLSPVVYRADYKAPFTSIHGTLNHLLAVDRLWLYRLTGKGTPPKKLDEMMYDDFSSLRTARQGEDERIIWYVDGLTTAALAKDFAYRDMDGNAQHQLLQLLIGHFFNHQTHHRGQIHQMINQEIGKAIPLDFIYYLQEKQAAQDCFTCTPKSQKMA